MILSFVLTNFCQGCFGFGPKSPTGKKRGKTTASNPLKFFSNEIWYQGYSKVWNEIETKLEVSYNFSQF